MSGQKAVIQYADVFRRGCEDVTQLSETEQLQFDRILGAHFSLLFSAYTQLERGLIEDDVWQAYLNALSRYAAYPSYRAVWRNMRDGYPEDMRLAIEDVMSLKRERHGKLPWEENQART